MNTIYCPMIVDKNGQKYLCMGDIDSYYINPTGKELEKIKEILNTAYYSLSDAEKRKYTYKMFKFTTDKEPSNINDEWLAHQTYEGIEYYLDYDKYSFITTKNSAVNDFTYLAGKYQFRFQQSGATKDTFSVCIQAKNTDGIFTNWIVYYPFKQELQIIGNTDELNLWFCDTRSDMTPNKILSLIDDINISLEDADINVNVKDLIDPEDWQEIANVPDASEDERYYYPEKMPEYNIDK